MAAGQVELQTTTSASEFFKAGGGDGTTGNGRIMTHELAPITVAAADIHAPGSNTAAVVTYAAAAAGISHVITGIDVAYDVAPAAAKLLTITDGGTVIYSTFLTVAGVAHLPFPHPKKGAAASAMVITLAAGGSGVTGVVSVLNHWTEPV
jgi:hypothetical protein